MDKHTQNLTFAAQHIDTLIQRTSGARCRYIVMDDQYMSDLACVQLACDNNGNRLVTGNEYMIITCANGYRYYVDITWDSVLTACSEVFRFISSKL